MSQFTESGTTFQVRAEIKVAAAPEKIYDTVSDLARSGEWSPECQGGRWISGEPGQVGSVFQGDNVRGTEVVAWAPVIRGPWNTEAEVVAAERGRIFQWVILNSAGEKQDSTWTYEIEPDGDGGALLIHRYRLGRLTEGLAKIFEGLSQEERERFVSEWNAKLADDVAATLERVKTVIEKG
ncbi:SRPBCC family protein [Streptomyces sp. NPDC049577]|uniref:SRPBCC family protein n=1 Tax=Streptomyces sp. NPDC049577 TaxID=3155153 RepID=UPI0034356E5F